ncbi:PNK3P-domain-containing protein [Nadsonia fulvescens var. elongata DSM 6958]|uniref:PNK3P-domain-containing protein n=1 Tax=Nadsonia fulvescens var. elongata DSM 6958 TaxID=857566 RepID=A0A1E3PGR4_9ASCO|nr:PNK3P-domain-containing protein [Nadsonia fulvescens var. elongata DSM 6958]
MSNKRQADISSFFQPKNPKASRTEVSITGPITGPIKTDTIVEIHETVIDETNLTMKDGGDFDAKKSNTVILKCNPAAKPFTFGSRLDQRESKTNKVGFSLQENTLLKYVYHKGPINQLLQTSGTDATQILPVAAFDLDSTLTFTKNGSPFPANGSDWRWTSNEIAIQLRQLHQGVHQSNPTPHCLVIMSNQGGVVAKESYKRYGYLKQRLEEITKDLDLPIRVYAATKPAPIKASDNRSKEIEKSKDVSSASNEFRKPERGMWDAMVQDLLELGIAVDMKRSFYVGDAAGRSGDFSDSDLKFAQNIGLLFRTPEEFFQTVLI